MQQQKSILTKTDRATDGLETNEINVLIKIKVKVRAADVISHEIA
jgi:hypothetical protein